LYVQSNVEALKEKYQSDMASSIRMEAEPQVTSTAAPTTAKVPMCTSFSAIND